MSEPNDRCDDCNGELSCCGDPNPDGTPSTDCKYCRLLARFVEQESALARSTRDCEVLAGRLTRLELDSTDKLAEMVRELNAALRREIESELGVDSDMTSDEALQAGLEAIHKLKDEIDESNAAPIPVHRTYCARCAECGKETK